MEFIDVYDKAGNRVSTCERGSITEEIKKYSLKYGEANYALPVVHLMLANTKGQLYIVKRGAKDENPFLFDKTVGGHVTAGESFDESLKREALEEISVDIIISDIVNYPYVKRDVDLNKQAVVRPIDFQFWSKSIRMTSKGDSFIKRDRVLTYFGVYDGGLNFGDGEAVGYINISINDLKEEFKRHSSEYTEDLKSIIDKYEWYLSK
ncbi:MAG: NUDIX domain-containing protein [Bacillota bacterium]|nr:NUDIX domain-containing protein [Bacillota bacterium]